MGKRIKSAPLSSGQVLLLLVLLAAGILYLVWSRTPEGAPGDSPPEITLASQSGATQTPAGQSASRLTATVMRTRAPVAKMSAFDYFVLALSWSPDYCATSGSNDVQECSLGKKLGFVLHGLWPQNNQGYPSSCTSEKLPAAVKAEFSRLFPNDSLFDHEWEKHGTCSGLSPREYLALTQQIKESVTIPEAFRAPQAPIRTTSDQLVQAFVQANPGFNAASFEVNCSGSGRYLTEVYVCFSREGSPRACGADIHKIALKSCQNPDFLVRNTR